MSDIKTFCREPLNFKPNIHITKLDQVNMLFNLGLNTIDLIDIMILIYIKYVSIYCKPQLMSTPFNCIDDKNGNIYYQIFYQEFCFAFPIVAISKQDFARRVDDMERDTIILSKKIDGNLLGVKDIYLYKCSPLVEEFLEVF